MKILYDYRIFYLQKYGGISKYFIKLINEVNKYHYTKIIAPIHINEYLGKNSNLNVTEILKLNKHYKNTRFITNQINKFIFKNYYNFIKPDILHLTYYNKKIEFKKKSGIILTVYDLIHEKFGEKYNFRYPQYFKKEYLNVADQIICISENTKNDLLNYYKIDAKKISVIPLGIDRSQFFKETNVNFLKLPFILFVGDRKNYKNFNNFIRAFSLSKKLMENFNVICFGGENFDKYEIELFQKLKIKENKIRQFTGSDEELNYFYKTASLYVCSSLYEGFGLTILEAMNMNCPIVTSNRGSLREVGKNIVEYFNPENVEEISNVIENFVFSTEKIENQKKSFKEHLKKFSWESTAEKTIDLYKKICP